MNYSPHGSCYLWDASLIALHRVSDSLIALSYFAIPIVLVIFLIRRKAELGWRARVVVSITAAFIISCGSTHVMEFYNVTHHAYWIAGVVKAITAIVSLPAALIYIAGMRWFLEFKNPVRLLLELKELKTQSAEFFKAKKELEESGINDPTLALQTSHVKRLEKQFSEMRHRLDESLGRELHE